MNPNSNYYLAFNTGFPNAYDRVMGYSGSDLMGYDHFTTTRQEPKVAVCDRRYVFDAVAPNDSGKPLSFNAAGACPTYQLDKSIADAVLDQRRQEQRRMAEYIARDIPVVQSRNGIDGGMNPVFAAKLGIDNGQVYQLAGTTMVPGALPRETNPPAPTAITPKASQTSQRVVMASVPMSQTASQPKSGTPESKSVGLGGTNTDVAAQPKLPVGAASAPTMSYPMPHEAAPPSDAVAREAMPDLRTAHSTPPASDSGLLTGAQPVVPASSFESRWTALR